MSTSRLLAVCLVLLPMLGGPAVAQTLDLNKLPLVTDQNRAQIGRDYDASTPETYTLAIAANGLWGSQANAKRTAAERATNALQKCEHQAQQPCILVVQDGQPTGETTPRPNTLTYPTSFDATAIPFVRDEVRTGHGAKYAREPGHKAWTLHRNGAFGWSSKKPSQEEAVAAAMENCKKGANGGACFLYAVGDQVVFSRETNIRPE